MRTTSTSCHVRETANRPTKAASDLTVLRAAGSDDPGLQLIAVGVARD